VAIGGILVRVRARSQWTLYVGGNPAAVPMTATVSNVVHSLGQNWKLLTAAAFISMALPMVVFFMLQQYFVRGILVGAVKRVRPCGEECARRS